MRISRKIRCGEIHKREIEASSRTSAELILHDADVFTLERTACSTSMNKRITSEARRSEAQRAERKYRSSPTLNTLLSDFRQLVWAHLGMKRSALQQRIRKLGIARRPA